MCSFPSVRLRCVPSPPSMLRAVPAIPNCIAIFSNSLISSRVGVFNTPFYICTSLGSIFYSSCNGWNVYHKHAEGEAQLTVGKGMPQRLEQRSRRAVGEWPPPPEP